MEPTPSSPQTDFQLQRCIINSKFRKNKSLSSSTSFRYSLDLPVSASIFRFAIRRISFPFVCPPYDVSAGYAPSVICSISYYNGVSWSANVDTRTLSITTGFRTMNDLASFMQATLRTQTLLYTAGQAAALGWTTGGDGGTGGADNIAEATRMTVTVTNNDYLTFSSSKFRISFAKPPETSTLGSACAILGFPSTPVAMVGTSPAVLTSPIVCNLSGSNGSIYLTSCALHATARSARPVYGPFQNVMASMYANGQYLAQVNEVYNEPTIYNCAAGNRLDDFDLQLRYETGTVLNLGDNEIEIELELETMELNNSAAVRMREMIQLPVLRPFDTQKVFQSQFSSGSIRNDAFGAR